MKKVLIVGLLALGLLAWPQQRASAWIKVNFGVGLNFSFESGNNSWLWGAFNNGQVPGYPTDVPVGHHYPFGFGGYYAGPAYHDYGGYSHAGTDASTGGDAKQLPAGKPADTQPFPNGNGSAQPVSYYPPASYYTQPSYYTPSYYGYYGFNGYSSVPSYWYGY